MSVVYNEMLQKKQAMEKLAQQGKRKYEYDSDEDIEVKNIPGYPCFFNYSGDLNRELVRYSNGPKQLARRMVRYSSHDLNSELKVRYSGHRVFD